MNGSPSVPITYHTQTTNFFFFFIVSPRRDGLPRTQITNTTVQRHQTNENARKERGRR
ncbi:unnamed protein product [Tenebrio molitor]|nr:unnamed protein product [Tenebrio molitor]